MKKPKYRLVRKIKGTTNWRTCSLYDNGLLIKGGESEDKELVLRNKAHISAMYPDELYAILEI